VGVLVGVVFVLSTRDFLFADRGVTLVLRNVETGVEMSSLTATGVLFSTRGRCVGVVVVVVVEVVATTLGVNGDLFEAF